MDLWLHKTLKDFWNLWLSVFSMWWWSLWEKAGEKGTRETTLCITLSVGAESTWGWRFTSEKRGKRVGSLWGLRKDKRDEERQAGRQGERLCSTSSGSWRLSCWTCIWDTPHRKCGVIVWSSSEFSSPRVKICPFCSPLFSLDRLLNSQFSIIKWLKNNKNNKNNIIYPLEFLWELNKTTHLL